MAAKAAVDRVLVGHESYPAIALDRHRTLVAANAALTPLLHGVAPRLLEPPVNVLRIGLHPDGLAPRILHTREWRAHLLARLLGQHAATGDATLAAIAEALRGHPVPEAAGHGGREALGGIAAPLRLQATAGGLAFLSTTMVFGTAHDLTLADLAIEAFFPADAPTAMALRAGTG